MKLVADANVLFALAKPASVANRILAKQNIRLLAPDFALLELHKYRDEILEKTGESNFDRVMASLKTKVVFVDSTEYKGTIREVASKISDPGDVAYLALAVKLGVPIWSNDRHFKEQSLVTAFTTKELIELLGSA